MELIGPERDLTARFIYGSAVLDEEGLCTDERSADVLANRPSLMCEGARYLILGWQGLLGLGLLAGTWHLARRRAGLLLILLIVPLYVLLLSGGPEGAPRFRVLYLPIFSLLTALGIRAVGALSLPVRWVRGKLTPSWRLAAVVHRTPWRQPSLLAVQCGYAEAGRSPTSRDTPGTNTIYCVSAIGCYNGMKCGRKQPCGNKSSGMMNRTATSHTLKNTD